MLARRALEIVVDSPAADPGPRLRAFRHLLLLHLATETIVAFLRQRTSPFSAPALPAVVVASVLAGAMSFIPAAERFAAPIGAATLLASIVIFFPNLANHTFLLLVALLPFVLWNLANENERVLALGTLRWAAAIVLFSSGLQKVLHGTYFQGEFLAFQIAHGERFARVFELVIPAQEMARLKALGSAAGPGVAAEGLRSYVTAPPSVGAGPYRLESALALAASNFVWAFEIVAPFLLVWRRTRAWAAAITALFLFTVETGALELMFGLLFTATVLLFFRRNLVGKALPAFAAAYVFVIAASFEVLPKWLLFN